jgi:PST family polysaccharide transporter
MDGAFWNVGMALSNKVVTLAGQVALAWFLMPSDMGLANLALATVAFTAVLSVGGLGDVLLQRRRYDEESGQALWLSFGFSSLMGLAIIGLALASPAMGRPNLRGLLLVLALGTVTGAPATVLSAGLKNKLDFKGMALIQMGGGLFYTATAVVLAWAGWGPYALIVPVVPQQWLCMGAMLARGGKPTLEWPKFPELRILAKPTLALSLTGLFIGLQSQAPVFVCAWVLSSTALGHFSWGWAVAGQTVFLLATNLREVLLPTFTRLKDDPQHRAAVAMKTARVITAMLCIACGAQALLAGAVIGILVPAKWLPAVPVVVCASLGLAAQGLWVSGMAWLNACGKYRLLLKVSIFQTAASALLTWIGVRAGGLVGASIGCAVAAVLGALASVLPMGRQALLPAVRSWWKPLCVTALTWTACMVLSRESLPGEICAAVLFAAVTAWAWWLEDDGGLAGLVARVAGMVRPVPPVAGEAL